MKKVYIIHENDEWTVHLTRRLEQLEIPYESWFLDAGTVNLLAAPPEGVFYNRMSASSHTRDHRYSPELTSAVIDWLEFHGRKVINGSNALRMEVSKVKQYFALEAAGIQTPKTLAAVGKEEVYKAAEELGTVPFIIKHNRAGKGLGVQLFYSLKGLREHLDSEDFEPSVDGTTLVQQFIESPEGFVRRAEFINGKYLYTVRIMTEGGFELCPADACTIGDLFCPAPGLAPAEEKPMKFEILPHPHMDLIRRLEGFLALSKIDVAGVEFLEDANGNVFCYDVNTNTNYNSEAEEKAGVFAMLELAKYLGRELEKV